jgi:hypothetical protein
MTIYIEEKVDSKELFNLLIKNKIPCFLVKDVKTNEFTNIVVLENLKGEGIYKYRYLNKNRIAKFQEYELSDVPNAKIKFVFDYEGELIYNVELFDKINFCISISSYMIDKDTIEEILKTTG